MKELPPPQTEIPNEYNETLERIDSRIAEIHPLGIRVLDDISAEGLSAHDRAESCGCKSCWRAFWNLVEEWRGLRELDRAKERWLRSDRLREELEEDIERYAPDPEDDDGDIYI